MIVSERKRLIKSSEDIVAVIRGILRVESDIDRDKEHFWTIGLNNGNIIRFIELVSLGIVNMVVVHPRETFRLAIQKGVSSIIVCHNHPSGDIEPSKNDVSAFERLQKAGEILAIPLLDFLIISGDDYMSLKDNKRRKLCLIGVSVV